MRRNFADAATLEDGRRATEAVAGKDDGCFRICFASGSRGHEVDFASISDQVAAFLTAADNRRLTILGHFDTSLLPEDLRDRVETHGFSTYSRYLKALARCDLAIMPLTDDVFNRCKSAVRVIDAAAVSVPSVVGSVGDMQAMILPGQTGFVLDSAADWGAALDELAADPAAVKAMGQAARADLEARWSGAPEPHIIAPEVLEWIKG
jgi:glycosyltransferase involved in cell wall biosynthesis